MGAEALGRRLLGEVEEARLDEVLRSVSLSAQPELGEEGPFGIRPLDRLLRLFEQQQQQPPARQQHDPGSPPLGQPRATTTTTAAAPKPPPIIELTSANPGAGKTQLLYLLITHAILPRTYDGILPRTYDGIPLSSGHAGAVVIVDTDNRFCAARLAAVARSHVWRRAQKQKKKLDPAVVNALITASLAHR
ncbi:hypothetical protein BFW01_g385 [Lasiodiplodia theobromae]|uniref:Uncharacterized protein n=1 Tax=Lasiodiplodia theobromae TaxID=45133 RepID=A0A8H7MB93_9PEZI|nr:hypothetical protein BFW01_g385 [Lasiodiplodia theobromae]